MKSRRQERGDKRDETNSRRDFESRDRDRIYTQLDSAASTDIRSRNATISREHLDVPARSQEDVDGRVLQIPEVDKTRIHTCEHGLNHYAWPSNVKSKSECMHIP
jgi:hypothetical protein